MITQVIKVLENVEEDIEIRIAKINPGFSVVLFAGGESSQMGRIFPYAMPSALDKATAYAETLTAGTWREV